MLSEARGLMRVNSVTAFRYGVSLAAVWREVAPHEPYSWHEFTSFCPVLTRHSFNLKLYAVRLTADARIPRLNARPFRWRAPGTDGALAC
jgi:hypothetical protein